MRIGSLFSGIGGLELGLERATGARTVWQCEQNEYCNRVLARHWPDAERWENVETFKPGKGSAEIICGGFPCQDLSVAGRGAGLAGARSGLWRQFARIVSEVEPIACVVENAGRGWRRWVPHVRADLAALGYHSAHMRVRAMEAGAPHERSRVFIIAAHPDRLNLWKQSRRGCGPDGKEATQPLSNGAQGLAADTVCEGLERQQDRNGHQGPGPATGRPATFWASGSPEPVLCGVDDGAARRVERKRLTALGNAVVPQVAEIVGRELLEVFKWNF